MASNANQPTVLLALGSALTRPASAPRDLIAELRRIVAGKSLLMPTLEHAEAAVRHFDQLIEDVSVRDEMLCEVLTDLVAAETQVRELRRALQKSLEA